MALTDYIIIAILIALAYGIRRVLLLEKRINALDKSIAKAVGSRKKK